MVEELDPLYPSVLENGQTSRKISYSWEAVLIMADSGNTSNLQKSGNELGAKTTYELFLEKEAVPVVRGFHIEDINSMELHS